jgi:hypothetical protein
MLHLGPELSHKAVRDCLPFFARIDQNETMSAGLAFYLRVPKYRLVAFDLAFRSSELKIRKLFKLRLNNFF